MKRNYSPLANSSAVSTELKRYIESIRDELRDLEINKENAASSDFSREDKKLYATVITLGLFIGVVFLFSSQAAAERYLNYVEGFPIHAYLAWMVWLPSVGGVITNALFNIESYFTIISAIKSLYIPKAQRVFNEPRSIIGEHKPAMHSDPVSVSDF